MAALQFVPVETDAMLRRCHALMAELRPHLDSENALLAAWRRQQAEGYRLLALCADDAPVALAGYRILHTLVHGRHLYVDDLVTTATRQGEGLGGQLLERLKDEARRLDCGKLLLDTPMSNALGQRFYFRHGLLAGALRFNIALPPT
jgi:GNAT superfamily N-acetyltransferase